MPPVLDPNNSKFDGLAFLGLSLARKSAQGHPDSQTHQVAFDLNAVQDREYEHIFSTNDDGWLVGGGEPGPPRSYKLPAPDSAHVELMRIGTYNPLWGGVSKEVIVDALKVGKILIPEITVTPTAVVANGDQPPELEIRFDMEPALNWDPDQDALPPLPVNWQLRFVHNQLFRLFQFPSRFCPGAFHSTILRKAEFRSEQHRQAYFAKCDEAVKQWRSKGPQPLVIPDKTGSKLNISKDIKRVQCPKMVVNGGELGSSHEYKSGIWLFTDREHITHLFEPNFLPPYDTPEKRRIIADVLFEEWDEETLAWMPAASLPKPVPVEKKPDKGHGWCGMDTDGLCGTMST